MTAERGLAYQTPHADRVTLLHALTGRDSRWVQRAYGVALTSAHPTFQLGALAVRGGAPVAVAVNRFRNHPRVVSRWVDCSVHAEQALTEYDIAGSVVYVARVTPAKVMALAKPCQDCLHSLTMAGVKRVIWTHTPYAVAALDIR